MKTRVPVIEVREVSKSYPTGFWRKRLRVLTDITFTVGANEIVGFLGPNGAGKTTTIKILNRLAFQDQGSVRIFGEEVGTRSGTRRRIGFMPEQPYFYEYLTGDEFLSLCGHLNGLKREEVRSRAPQVLSRVGLGGAGGKSIRKYSKGMLQRLGLAQALLHDPDLVILDEPMSGLDPMGRMEVRTIIRELAAAGKTVFFSTHIISDVEALCDRVIMLNGGKKVAEGTVDQLVGGEVQFVELAFFPPPPDAWMDRSGISPECRAVQGDTLVLRASNYEEANRWIEAVRGAGSQVRSCIPCKRRLEDIYVEQVAGSAADAALLRSYRRAGGGGGKPAGGDDGH